MTRHARDCYRGVEAALPVIAPFARHDDDAVALAALALLGGFHSQISIDTLRDIVSHQPTGPRLAVALVALAQLDPPTTLRAAAPRVHDIDRALAIHAAVACVLADPEQATDDTVAALTAPLPDDVDTDSPLTGELPNLISRTLERLPERHLARVVHTIAARLPSLTSMANLDATASLLRLVCPDGAPTDAAELTDLQRHALDAIADHGAFLVGDGMTFGNYTALLGDWNLPSDAAALRRWLDGGAR
jgi:hypothetical protein